MKKRKIIYAVTTVVKAEGADKWRAFMEDEHIPLALSKGYLDKNVRLLDLPNDSNITELHRRFKVVFVAESEAVLNEYKEKCGAEMANNYVENVGDITIGTPERIVEPFTEITAE